MGAIATQCCMYPDGESWVMWEHLSRGPTPGFREDSSMEVMFKLNYPEVDSLFSKLA